VHGRVVVRRSVRRLRALPEGVAPNRELLEDLISGWGNPDYSAPSEFAERVMATAVATKGQVLECGSGMTTLLLGIAAEKTGSRVWTLENSDEWAEKLLAALRRARIDTVELVRSPIRDYGGFAWYDAPLNRLPLVFDLVVCDGPVATETKGGRYGLLPLLANRIASGCPILLDDAARPSERAVISRWADEFGATSTLHGVEKPYAVLRLSDTPAQ
jgi:hypothetical protein